MAKAKKRTDLDDKELRQRAWYADLSIASDRQLRKGQCPLWLKDLQNDGVIARVRGLLELRASVDDDFMSVALTLDRALSESQPRPHAEIRKDIDKLAADAQRLLDKLRRVDPDVASELFGRWDCGPIADDLTGSVFWEYDAVDDLTSALKLFVDRVRQASIPTMQGGKHTQITTLAIVGLVGLLIEHQVPVDPRVYAEVAEDLLGPVIDLYNERYKANIAHPDWRRRINDALAEREPPRV